MTGNECDNCNGTGHVKGPTDLKHPCWECHDKETYGHGVKDESWIHPWTRRRRSVHFVWRVGGRLELVRAAGAKWTVLFDLLRLAFENWWFKWTTKNVLTPSVSTQPDGLAVFPFVVGRPSGLFHSLGGRHERTAVQNNRCNCSGTILDTHLNLCTRCFVSCNLGHCGSVLWVLATVFQGAYSVDGRPWWLIWF